SSRMADTSDAPENETPNQRQARLRREKRQKKMAEQGEDRLARIKALNGGVAPPEEVLGGPVAQGTKSAYVEDPDEVDISTVTPGNGTPSRQQHVDAVDNPLAAAMLQMQQEQARNQRQQRAEGSAEEDPMARMMEQMMGLMGGDPSNPNAKPPDLPPALKALMGGVGGAAGAQQQEPPATSSTYLWRAVHAVFALLLAGYIAVTSTFTGSKLAREPHFYASGEGHGLERRLFLIFCTAELVLQSTRYFAEKGQLRGNGMLAKVANSGFVPEPWAGYVRIVGRYVGIAQTIMTDAMVIVFVFGAMAWWRGAAAA
ncbi:hypothetical protein BDY17DRAFT_257913, partial [Neohortaea acidophila]